MKRVFDDMPDICIDVPAAYTLLEQLGGQLYQHGCLSEAIYKEMPARCVRVLVNVSWRLEIVEKLKHLSFKPASGLPCISSCWHHAGIHDACLPFYEVTKGRPVCVYIFGNNACGRKNASCSSSACSTPALSRRLPWKLICLCPSAPSGSET